jgi:hypothetical protein
MGGKVKKKSTETIGSQTLNILGFVWENVKEKNNVKR